MKVLSSDGAFRFAAGAMALFWAATASPFCPGVPNCHCYFSPPMQSSIYCHYLQDFTQLTDMFRTNPRLCSVKKLVASNCAVTKLKSKTFLNVTIMEFNSDCPLQDIEDDTFDNVANMTKLLMTNTAFTDLPGDICRFRNLRSLWLRRNNLKTLKCEFPRLYDINLSNGDLEEVSSSTFALSTGLRYVDLSYNNLTLIADEAFDNCKAISNITLRGNGLLSAQRLFRMLNPKAIDLSNNNITELNNVFHTNMWQLEHLDVSRNTLENVDPSVFLNNTPNVKFLDMTFTGQSVLNPELLKAFPRLEVAKLDHIHVQRVPSGFFEGLTELNLISFTYGSLKFIAEVFVNLPKLHLLQLSQNRITSLDHALRNLPVLKSLLMKYNRLNGIYEGDLDLPSLETLDLSHNSIVYISRYSFAKLRKLKRFDLSGNSFYRLNNSVQNLDNLERLYLQNGGLRDLADDFAGLPSLVELDLSDNDIQYVGEAFRTLVSLKSLNLASNSLKTLPRDSLPENIILTGLQMAGNPWICDCRFSWLVEWLVNTSRAYLLDDPVCASPLALANKPLWNLTFEDLDYNVDRCPNACNCGCQSWTSSALVNCTGTNQTDMPLVLPNDVGLLDMSNNLVSNVTSLDLRNYRLLQEINLTNNSVAHINILFPSSMRVLRLATNKFSRPPLNTLGNPGLSLITLSSNPWICDCLAMDFYKWLKEKRNLVKDIDDVRCAVGYLKGQVIVNLSEDDFCPSKSIINVKTIYIIVGITLSAVVLLAIFCSLNLGAKAWLYSLGLRCIKKEDQERNKLYDGLLLYSAADRIFALEAIAAGLETVDPKFALYIPSLATGGDGSNLSGALRMCARVIIVFSQNFIHDQSLLEILCSDLMTTPYPIRPIIIQYGKQTSLDLMEGLPKSVLDCGIRLRWGECCFWKKLKFLMPKTSTTSKRAVEDQNTDSEPLMP